MTELISYLGDPELKKKVVAQVQAHYSNRLIELLKTVE